MVHILAAVAEDERERIRSRTRDGLAVAKRKGIKLGNPPWQDSIEAAREEREANVAKQRKLVLPILKGLHASGHPDATGQAVAPDDG